MTQKSLEERITSFETKAQKLLAQAKVLKAKKIEQDRKSRTRRLIQIGAVVENVLGHEVNDLKEFENRFRETIK